MVHTLIWFVVASSIWTPLQHPNPNWQASWIEWSLPGHWPLYTLPLGEVELNAASQNVWHIALFWSVPNSWPIDASKIRERNIWKVYYAIIFIFCFYVNFTVYILTNQRTNVAATCQRIFCTRSNRILRLGLDRIDQQGTLVHSRG